MPDFRTDQIIVQQGTQIFVPWAPEGSELQDLLDVLTDRRYERTVALLDICKIAKTVDRAGVTRWTGLNFLGSSVVELTRSSTNGYLGTTTTYNGDGAPLERHFVHVDTNGTSGTASSWFDFEYDDAQENPNPLSRGNLVRVTQHPGAVGSVPSEFGLIPMVADPSNQNLPTSISAFYTYEPLTNQVRTATDARGATTEIVYEYQESQASLAAARDYLDWFGVVDDSVWSSLPVYEDLNGDGSSYARPLAVAVTEPPHEIAGGQLTSFTTTYQYNGFGDVATVTDTAGHSTLYTYSDRWDASSLQAIDWPEFPDTVVPTLPGPTRDNSEGGPLVQVTETINLSAATVQEGFPGESGVETSVTTYYRGGPGGRVTYIFFEGAATASYTYDDHFRVDTYQGPDGALHEYTYDGAGRLITEDLSGIDVDALHVRTFRGADGTAHARCFALEQGACQVTLSDLMWLRTSEQCDPAENPAGTCSPTMLLETYEVDGESRLTGYVSPDERGVAFLYHPWGGVAETRAFDNDPDSPLRTTTTWFDDFGQPLITQLASPGGAEMLTSYRAFDAYGRRIANKDADGRVAVRELDAVGAVRASSLYGTDEHEYQRIQVTRDTAGYIKSSQEQYLTDPGTSFDVWT
ncbi:MAG: hypothetical protein ABIK85_05185, partial [Candidatus Eisenbacteria bacterium]